MTVCSCFMVLCLLSQSEWHGICVQYGTCRSYGGPHGAPHGRLHTLATRFNLWRGANPQWGCCYISSRNAWHTPSRHNTRCGGEVRLSSRTQHVFLLFYLCMSQNQNINFRNRTQEDSRVTYTANSKSSWFTQGQKKHIRLEERKRKGEKGEKK